MEQRHESRGHSLLPSKWGHRGGERVREQSWGSRGMKARAGEGGRLACCDFMVRTEVIGPV